MLYFFYYSEFRVSGSTDTHYADGTISLPSDTDLTLINQRVRGCIQDNNPKVIRSSIVVKNISRLG